MSVLSGTIVARILKHVIHMDNELLNCGIENWTHCSYSCLNLSIFLSFKAKFVSQFSQELFKFESSIKECNCKMSDHIVGLRNELFAPFSFFIHFSLFPISYVNIENLCQFSWEILKLIRTLELGICMDDEMWYGVIKNQAHCSYSSLYLSIFLFLRLNLCHSFLRNY